MIISAKWILPINKNPIKDGSLFVREGVIKDIGKTTVLTKKYKNCSHVDMGMSAIMPGFIDCHTHLEYSILWGLSDDLPFGLWKIQQQEKSKLLNKKDRGVSAKLGCQEMLRSGITTIADVSSTGASLDAALETGLRGVIFYGVGGLKFDGKIIEKAIKDIDSWQDKTKNSLLDIGVSSHAAYTTAPGLIKEVSNLAKDKELLSCIHVSGSLDEYQFVKYGSGPLAHRFKELTGFSDVLWQPMGASPVKYLKEWGAFEVPTIAIHCIHVDEEDLDILAKNKVRVVHCPRCAAKLGMGIAPLKKFLQRKLTLGLGTDSPASNNTTDLFEEMRLGLLVQRAFNKSTDSLAAKDFLKMATLGGAQALGKEKEIGSLEINKKADLIAVDLSQSYHMPASEPYSAIVYTCTNADVLLTMINGRICYRKDDEQIDKKLYKQVNDLRSKLAKK